MGPSQTPASYHPHCSCTHLRSMASLPVCKSHRSCIRFAPHHMCEVYALAGPWLEGFDLCGFSASSKQCVGDLSLTGEFEPNFASRLGCCGCNGGDPCNYWMSLSSSNPAPAAAAAAAAARTQTKPADSAFRPSRQIHTHTPPFAPSAIRCSELTIPGEPVKAKWWT